MIELAVLLAAGAASLLASRSRRAWMLRPVSQYERPPLAAFPPEYGSVATIAFQNIDNPNWWKEARAQVVEPASAKSTTTILMLDDVGLDFPKGTFLEVQASNVLRLEAPASR